MFSGMMKDSIVIIKRDGRTFNIKHAIVNPTEILIHDAEVPVEEGDVVEHALPSGLLQRFTVLDRGYHGSFMDFPAGYDMKVKRLL